MPIDNKEVKYPMSQAKFIRVNDSTGLKVVKEGQVFTYWPPTRDRMEAFGTITGGIVSDKVRTDLGLVLLRSQFDVSTKNDFPPYVTKKERDKVAQEHKEKVEKELDAQRKQYNATLASGSPPVRPPTPPASAGVFTHDAAPIVVAQGDSRRRAGTGSSFVKSAPKKARNKIKDLELIPPYNNLSDKEMYELYACYYKWLHGNTTKLADSFKSKSTDEIKDNFDDFVFDGLMNKTVKDDEIPSLEILKKIPPVANDRSLMLYYERKLNRSKSTEVAGKTFDASVLPKSWKVAFGTAKMFASGMTLAAKSSMGAVSALNGLLSKLGETKEEPRNDSIKNTTEFKREQTQQSNEPINATEFKREQTQQSNEPINATREHNTSSQAAPNVIRENPTRVNGDISPKESTRSEEVPETQPIQEEQVNSEKGSEDPKLDGILRFIGKGLSGIKEILEKRLPISTPNRKVDDTEKDAVDNVGVDQSSHITELNKQQTSDDTLRDTKLEVSDTSSTSTGDGIFGTIAKLFTGFKIFNAILGSATKLLGSFKSAITNMVKDIGVGILSGLTSVFSKVPAILEAILASPATAVGGIVAAAGALVYETYEHAKSIGKDFEAGRHGDKAAEKRFEDAQQTLEDVSEGGQQNEFQEGISYLFGKKDPKSTSPTRPSDVKIKGKEVSKSDVTTPENTTASKLEDGAAAIVATSRDTSSRVAAASNEKEAVKESREDQRTQAMVDASTKSSTIINSSGGGVGIMPQPRTSNSTFQRYLDSRARFA